MFSGKELANSIKETLIEWGGIYILPILVVIVLIWRGII